MVLLRYTEGFDTGYIFICTASKRGCMKRHGGPTYGVRWLDFKYCPKCLEYARLYNIELD